MSDLLSQKTHVVFDAYGTLFDVHSAVQRHADEIGSAAPQLSETWRVKQLEYAWVLSLIGGYEGFWTLTEKALDFALERHPGVDRGLRSTLLDAYRRLDAFPEVPRTLKALREAGLKTAILSNANQQMLEEVVASARLSDRLDAVLSVDEVGIFKPAQRAYALACEALNAVPESVVFCSSNRWDIAGATASGFTTVWVNRKTMPDEYPELAPTQVVRGLDQLL